MPVRPFLDSSPTLGERVYVDPLALVVGDVVLGDDVSIWPFTVVRGDSNYVRIGARSNVQDGSVLHIASPTAGNPAGYPLLIGEEVTIGHKAVVHACTVGHRCLVGIGAIVLDGAVIEDEVMIGAGSVVPPGKRLERGGLYLGSPARRVRDLTDAELARLAYMARHYVELKDAHAGSLEAPYAGPRAREPSPA
jgi:carbonic anhydrase/acetyltransferase-like protein (isoleucine patch superfamily)